VNESIPILSRNSIESGNYDRIEFEWKKVLDLRLGGKYEGAVAQSLLTIAYKLSEAKQLALAQRILDYTLAEVSFSNKNKADILKLEAYLFKEAGELEKAIETYRKANELFVKP
jgi:tetratricopeptide (TPR) repeat protein